MGSARKKSSTKPTPSDGQIDPTTPFPAPRDVRLKGHLEPTSVGPKWEHFSLEIDMTELKAEGFQGELGRGRIQQIWITPTAADMTKITLSVKRLRSGVGELDRFVDEVKAAQKPCP